MAAAYGKHGVIDWDKYKELVKGIDFLTYDPPQKRREFFAAACRNINFFTPRSPCCVGFPLCGSELMQCFVKSCWGDEVQHDNVANETVMSMESGFWGYPPSMDSGLPELDHRVELLGVNHADAEGNAVAHVSD
eukprot:g5070.t1